MTPKGEEKRKHNISHNYAFPKNTSKRSFQLQWLSQFNWLEYSKVADAAFCYPCRQFCTSSNTSDAFTTTGFRNWSVAISDGRGFKKHEKCHQHHLSMLSWSERKSRQSSGAEISTLLSENVLSRRRHYMRAIVRTVLFLAENELGFRGNWDALENNEHGLFNLTFEFISNENPSIKEAGKSLPPNLNYRSPEIQNEIVTSAAFCLQRTIAKKINEAPFYTVMVDGTRDKNGDEILSIAFRYVSGKTIQESLLEFVNISKLDAMSIANAVLSTMEKFDLDQTKLISQCYDGASVMSGERGGVQRIIADHCQRKIPFVHCFNHRLHLVVIHSIKGVRIISEFFDYLRAIRNFLALFNVKRH